MGGQLRLVGEFSNRPPVATTLSDITGSVSRKPNRRAKDQKATEPAGNELMH